MADWRAADIIETPNSVITKLSPGIEPSNISQQQQQHHHRRCRRSHCTCVIRCTCVSSYWLCAPDHSGWIYIHSAITSKQVASSLKYAFNTPSLLLALHNSHPPCGASHSYLHFFLCPLPHSVNWLSPRLVSLCAKHFIILKTQRNFRKSRMNFRMCVRA